MNDFNPNSQLHDMFDGFEASFSQDELQADWQSMADKIGAADTGLQGDAGSSGAAGSSSGGFMASGTAKILGLVAGLASIGAVLFLTLPTEDDAINTTPETTQVVQLTAAEANTEAQQEALPSASDNASENTISLSSQEHTITKPQNVNPSTPGNRSTQVNNGGSGSDRNNQTLTTVDNEEQSPTEKPTDTDVTNKKNERPVVTVGRTALCANSPISLKLDNARDGATYTWSLLKEGTSKDEYSGSLRSSVSKVIGQEGKYDLVVIELNKDNQPSEIARRKVNVMAQPRAIEIQSNQTPCDAFEFTGVAENATTYAWEINGKTHPKETFEFTFKEMGTQQVSFIAKNGACADTLDGQVDFFRSNKGDGLELANVITPNGDGKNDEYNILEKNPELQKSNPVLTIFDQNQITVFQSSTEAMTWNGKKMNVGDQCVTGQYFYVLTYDQPCSKAQKEQVFGSIYLSR